MSLSPHHPSLPEVHRSIPVPTIGKWWRKFLAYAGPGYLVSVGYMDPGNWATDIAGGSQFGYRLLSVIFVSNLMAIVLQSLCVRLGVATGLDLAQMCREYFGKKVNFVLWVLCEISIVACDLAELLGSAIALQLLFHIPLMWGVCLTALDVLLLMSLVGKGFRKMEALMITLISTVGICFIAQLCFARPSLTAVIQGYVPSLEILAKPEMLYVAVGILGATVMPHNLYLHSSIIQTRAWAQDHAQKAEAIKFGIIDTVIALFFALGINSAILIVAAAAFHTTGHQQVGSIETAYQLLSPVLGVSMASTLFALALLAAGQSSTLTATLAGQIVMEGFLQIKLKPWVRRLMTRMLAVIPALLAIGYYGEQQVSNLIIFSQVILSLQLPFAVIPLVLFTSNRQIMGKFVSPNWLKSMAWSIAAIIVGLNGWLLWRTVNL
jgi:manganese transport protein